MKKFLCLALLAASLGAQPLQMDANNWLLTYAFSNSQIKLTFPKTGGVSWSIPLSGANKSPGSPYVTGEWAGYLQYFLPYQHTRNILTLPTLSGSIAIQGTVAVSLPAVVFRYDSESFNTCPAPASLHVEFEGYNAESTPWRSWNVNPILLSPGTFSWAGTMDPGQWIDVNGERANLDAAHLADFDATRTNTATSGPYFIGATHGGGCFYGHGVNVSGGTSTVTFTSFAVNQ